MQQTRRRNAPRISWFTVALCAIVLYFAYTIIDQQLGINALNRDMMQAEERLAAARRANDMLKAEKEQLSKEEYIEKTAREELGMTKEGELPYIVKRQ